MREMPGDRIAEELNYYMLSNKRWSQRIILEQLFYAITYGTDHKPLDFDYPDHPCLQNTRWLDEMVDVCQWEGVTCGNIHPSQADRPRLELDLVGKVDGTYDWGPWEEYRWPAHHFVTKIDLQERSCRGTLPKELYMLPELRRLNLRGNSLRGVVPITYHKMEKLDFLDLSYNRLSGTAWHLTRLPIEELWLGSNNFDGALHSYLSGTEQLKFLDISNNQITGTIPRDVQEMRGLVGLLMDQNKIVGTIPSEIGRLTHLEYLFLESNSLEGTIPTELGKLYRLQQLRLHHNHLNGTIATEFVNLVNLQEMQLHSNRLSGSIPAGDDMGGEQGFRWSQLSSLQSLLLANNKLTGSLPPPFVLGLSGSLTALDVGFNFLTGTLPPELGRMNNLIKLAAPSNDLQGTLPFELGRLTKIKELNFTSNRLVGTIPRGLCDESRGRYNVKLFGCDAILCPAGKFHPNGAANNLGACRPCPKSKHDDVLDPPYSQLLGRTTCDGASFLVADMDSDGLRSSREILHLLFVQNSGFGWGDKYQAWTNVAIPDCQLPGIGCTGSEIVKIDLSDANLCVDPATGKQAPQEECHGVPAEISQLSNLEVISMPQRAFLGGSIPSEIGLLTRLRYIDFSHCPNMRGTIPTEIGNLKNLKVLNLASSHFSGPIPSEIFGLPLLEKLHLNANYLTGTIPTQLGNARNIRELMLSRLYLNGTIPQSIGRLTLLENCELYGSSIRGTIPAEIGSCQSLKRFDAFNNKLTGTIPTSLGKIESLQIIHLKKNQLTGRLPEELTNLKHLSWVDLSGNILSGSIPSSYGNIRSLSDLRLGGNRLHDPIPTALCNNNKINGGRARSFGCDAILCPLGYFDATGYAYEPDEGCRECPVGTTTIYLGGTECMELHAEDILSIFFDVMGGEFWDPNDSLNWKSEDLSVCTWGGVSCEDDGTLLTLSFPLPQIPVAGE
jgi:LRR receptor-like serine/threonine-protein kinase FLS2